MKKTETTDPTPGTTAERKPYTAPRIEESGRFEHLVLMCAKLPKQGPCSSNPTS